MSHQSQRDATRTLSPSMLLLAALYAGALLATIHCLLTS